MKIRETIPNFFQSLSKKAVVVPESDGDFARALGRGVFIEAQLAQHREFWRSATSRKAVVTLVLKG